MDDGISLTNRAHPQLRGFARILNKVRCWLAPKFWRLRGVVEEIEIEIRE